MNNELSSINYNTLCETKPIFRKPKMIITLVKTMVNNKKQRTANYQKQTQTNPIYSELVEPILPATPFSGQVLTAVPAEVKVLPL